VKDTVYGGERARKAQGAEGREVLTSMTTSSGGHGNHVKHRPMQEGSASPHYTLLSILELLMDGLWPLHCHGLAKATWGIVCAFLLP